MQRNRTYELPVSTIYLVPSNNWLLRWREKQQRFPYLPPVEQAVIELNHRSNRNAVGVPATVHMNSQGREELRLYGSEYYLGLYPSQYGDGYILSYTEPMDGRAYDMLADGVLLLKRAYYQLCTQLPDIPPGSINCKEQIWQEWQALEQHKQRLRSHDKAQEVVTLKHKKYLDNISSLIDISYQLEQDKHQLSSMIPYLSFTATDQRRSGLHDIYEFRLLRPLQIWQERYLLRIANVPDLRGRIVSLSGTRLKIKFETSIDRKRIPNQGSFEVVPNKRIFDVQRKAVTMFQEGTARNSHLLQVLVDRQYQFYKPATHVPEGLNKEQLAAFQHALTVPDLLLVLGPPGTGKTHTIREIIHHHCLTNKKHVLITARTHKAVDNALSRLPPSLEVVRLGHEDRVSEETRHLLLDAKAKVMQEEILRRTKQQASALSYFLEYPKEIMGWRRELLQCIQQMELYEQQQQHIQERKQQAIQRILVAFDEELTTMKRQLQKCERQLYSLDKRRRRWQAAWTKHASRAHFFAIGWFFAWRSQVGQHRLIQTQDLFEEMQGVCAAMKQAGEDLQEQIQRALWADAEYRMTHDAQQQIEQSLFSVSRRVSRIVGLLHGTVEHLLPVPPLSKDITATMLRHYSDWYDQHYPLLAQRAALMHDWCTELEEPTTQLHPEIIRYADVIGATCIGVATTEGLEDIDFDLAIVDEAGQICITDLLVPLARTSRAVLVGDHRQLPPFVSNEVYEWLESLTCQEEEQEGAEYGVDNETIRSHLLYSAFELLFAEAANNRHLIRLTHQFRMPRVIADFASQHFYEHQLYTVDPEQWSGTQHHDPLFHTPFVLINTSSQAAAGYREKPKLKSEDWGGEGYTNEIEARLISSLVACYEQTNAQWVVIVPYRAQAQYIVELLQKQPQSIGMRWEERISTVDAFQGSECEKVIYGFTRSNTRGNVGFLAELRRLNVALTRAKEQLVVIGDFSMLVQANNEGFRNIAKSLYHHTQQHGEVLSYEQCMQHITAWKRKEKEE